MSKRQNDWARRTLDKLAELVGKVCAACGAEDDLTFDCINPTGHTLSKSGKSTVARATHYRRQFEQGNLQRLCGKCNRSKSDRTPEELAAEGTAIANGLQDLPF